MYCKYWVIKSKRYCKNKPLPNGNYCRVHKAYEAVIFDEVLYNIIINTSDPVSLSSLFRLSLSTYKLYRSVAVWKKLYQNHMPYFNGETQLKYFTTVNINNPLKKYRELVKYHNNIELALKSTLYVLSCGLASDVVVVQPRLSNININISVAKQLFGCSYYDAKFRISTLQNEIEYTIMSSITMRVNIDEDKFISYLTILHGVNPAAGGEITIQKGDRSYTTWYNYNNYGILT